MVIQTFQNPPTTSAATLGQEPKAAAPAQASTAQKVKDCAVSLFNHARKHPGKILFGLAFTAGFVYAAYMTPAFSNAPFFGPENIIGPRDFELSQIACPSESFVNLAQPYCNVTTGSPSIEPAEPVDPQATPLSSRIYNSVSAIFAGNKSWVPNWQFPAIFSNWTLWPRSNVTVEKPAAAPANSTTPQAPSLLSRITNSTITTMAQIKSWFQRVGELPSSSITAAVDQLKSSSQMTKLGNSTAAPVGSDPTVQQKLPLPESLANQTSMIPTTGLPKNALPLAEASSSVLALPASLPKAYPEAPRFPTSWLTYMLSGAIPASKKARLEQNALALVPVTSTALV